MCTEYTEAISTMCNSKYTNCRKSCRNLDIAVILKNQQLPSYCLNRDTRLTLMSVDSYNQSLPKRVVSINANAFNVNG